MAFWLASKRQGQHAGYIQRFDPRFWTVDFARPMMAALTTPAPDVLRADATFLRRNDLAGIIWESADRWDHPLLAYVTDCDYSRTTLSFRWRSSGLPGLDAINGPTLTIEGRDSQGGERTWYVRLWNYATGTPTDAHVVLPFSALAGGFLLPDEADSVHPVAVERMFVSLVPGDYDPADAAPLEVPVEAWAELSDIACEGNRAMLEIGDVLVPPHGLAIATGYDDGYNQTPARLLRSARGLGYRGTINHYVGMSHFMALQADGAGDFLVDVEASPVNRPSREWHRSFLAAAKAMGFEVIFSLSYELLAQHCPASWQQRASDGTPARTGWDPPSALLSPASSQAMDWLKRAATAFVALVVDAGLPVRFQVGEPWWWVTPEGGICLYDDAARAALQSDGIAINDLGAALSEEQLALLDRAGSLLAMTTAELGAAVRAGAGGNAQLLLLAYLPTVLDPERPELARANLPLEWASPAFDVLQLEAYDWVTGGNDALHRRAVELADDRLGYPAHGQHYITGFVLDRDERIQWRAIDAAATAAQARGVAMVFVWAMPQVCRDGYVRLPDYEEEEDMQAFDDVLYPIALGREAAVLPEFSTAVTVTASGHERRNSLWSDARLRFDVGPGIRSDRELDVLLSFFRARRGQARGFLLQDPSDNSSAGMTDAPGPFDQLLGVGDGASSAFPLIKTYGSGDAVQKRRITRPRAATLRVAVDGLELTEGWSLLGGGTVQLAQPPAAGAEVRAGFRFDVPVRFAEDRLEIAGSFAAGGEVPSVPLIEIREAA